ncbi:16825_t:CDS:2, partial [Gigaspora rosea]
ILTGKFVVENSEQYITVASATKVDKKDSSDEFNAELVPLNTPHLMFNATVTRDLNTIETENNQNTDEMYQNDNDDPKEKEKTEILTPNKRTRNKRKTYQDSDIDEQKPSSNTED